MWSILLSAWDISSTLSFHSGWSSRRTHTSLSCLTLQNRRRSDLTTDCIGVNIPHQEDEDSPDTSHDIAADCLAPASHASTNKRPASSHGTSPANQWGASLRLDEDHIMTRNVSRSVSCLLSPFCLHSRIGLVDGRKHFEINIKTGNTDFRLTDPSVMQGWKNVSKFSSYRFLLIWNHENVGV